MSFVPEQGRSLGSFNPVRTILFWFLMVGLAVVLWQMVPHRNQGNGSAAIPYSSFMDQVDRNNVASVALHTSSSTAEVQGELRQPAERFETNVPKEVIPDLTERLRKQGATVSVSAMHTSNWTNQAIDWGTLVLLLVGWIFLSRRRNRGQGGVPSQRENRPLG
ncbi:MAG: ATP-dependent metallopeptidase FtsH/Yme1/Tma family protein [Candidatus Acidiferrales bacterium]